MAPERVCGSINGTSPMIIAKWAAQRGELSALNRTMRAGTGERASLAYDA